jgi:CheY-like chemotaxis protein
MENKLLEKSKILIVDDNEANIDVLEGLLMLEGYENIKTTTDPRNVPELYSAFQPDLILLDLMMPYVSGFEVMEQLRNMVSKDTYLPILVLTADASDETKKRALSGGASDFLSKPFDLVEVGLRIKNLLFTSYLYAQQRNQNLLLEEKVRERTKELELKNEELKIAWEKAEAGNRVKTAFLNNISHEIRTPLNGIIGFGQLLTDPEVSFEDKSYFIEIINESSERLINTITSFLDISLLNSGNMEVTIKEVAPDLIISEIFDKYKILCQKRNLVLSVRLEPGEKTPVVLSDEIMLRKVLYHLVDNAFKFTKEGTIEMGYETDKNEVRFFVKDTGIGIASGLDKDIFKSFTQEYTGHTRGYEGNGLGLPIAKGFLDLLGGKIWFESNKDSGTVFYFTAPLLKENRNQESIPVMEKIPAKYKILIAEDDDINFQFLNVLLRSDNIEIVHAVDGVEAVQFCQKIDDFKMVLMDLKMPRMNGYEATGKIKTINRDLPVIAVTAYSEMEDRQKAVQAGCDDFIIKPIKKEILFEKLKKYNIVLQ